MKVVDIIFYVYLDQENGDHVTIGGVQTYISNLIELISTLGAQVRVFQYAKKDYKRKFGETEVYGYFLAGNHRCDFLYKKALQSREPSANYMTIFASDTLIPHNHKVENSIAIQHGIDFDACTAKEEPFLINFLKHQYRAFPYMKGFFNVDEVVCVDNNFICWYRTQTSLRKVKLTPILNFTKIGPEYVNKSEDTIKIVFARRFFEIRGTRLFVPVAKRLLEKYENIEFTFAGTGPEEEYMHKELADFDRVSFTTYKAENSLDFHSQFNIAVVPTLYSEGTSLSLLEAMSAHCAVVCTNIGGMTNIILDEYNGLMVSPDEEELFEALSRLIEDKALRQTLAERGYECVKASFSLEKWRKDWKKVLIQKL